MAQVIVVDEVVPGLYVEVRNDLGRTLGVVKNVDPESGPESWTARHVNARGTVRHRRSPEDGSFLRTSREQAVSWVVAQVGH